MRRLISVLLILMLCLSVFPAGAENASSEETRNIESFTFRFRFSLNPIAFPKTMVRRMRGYAELLDQLELRGTLSRSESDGMIDIQASLVPLSNPSAAIDFRLYGIPAIWVVTSPILGDEIIFLNTPALVDFGNKSWSHLSLPLHYAALLYPLSWELDFSALSKPWFDIVGHPSAGDTVTSAQIAAVADAWSEALQGSVYLGDWLTAVTLTREEALPILDEFEDLPSYLMDQVTQFSDLRVVEQDGTVCWLNSKNETLFRSSKQGADESGSLDLPLTRNGYKPSASWKISHGDKTDDYQFDAEYLSSDPGRNDLLSFMVNAHSIPVSWPLDTDFDCTVSLTGDLFPNIGFTLQGYCRADGAVSVSLCKPAQADSDPAVILRAEGTVQPTDPLPMPEYNPEGWMSYRNILSLADQSMGEFTNNITMPLIHGMLDFLAEIPVVSCQSILDDLTDSGILEMVLSK